MKARRAPALLILGRALGGIVVLAVLVLVALWIAIQRADDRLRNLLQRFAVTTVQTQSDSIYQLRVGSITFNWALRRVNVDSAILTTDSARNAARPNPKPALRIGLYDCRMSGVSLHKLVFSQGLWVQRFGCSVVTVDITAPLGDTLAPRAVAPQASSRGTQAAQARPGAFLAMQQGLKLPASVPRLSVGSIDFPHASFVLVQPRWHRGRARLALEHLEWHIRDVVIDPAIPSAAARPLFSRSVDLAADNFTLNPDSVSRIGVGKLRISLNDSTVSIGDIAFGPTVSDAVFARESPWRRSRARLSLGALHATGVDFGRLLRRGGFYARHIDIDSFVGDFWSDKRLPDRPHPSAHLTPQAWLAESPVGYGIDSLTVRGRIVYREVREGHERNGVLTFNRLRATARNVHHEVGRSTWDDPMTLTASAYLMNTGRLAVTFVVPLDAPSFAMTYRGSLGPMPAESLNGFIEHVFPARITGGQIDQINFGASVRSGVAHGELTPLYHHFGIQVTGRGASGILGAHGTLAHLARGVATWLANQTRIRPDNPEQPGGRPTTAPIAHTFVSPPDQLVSFVWLGLRDALLGVVKK